MNLIELHILQSFPVTCLNRDDLGSPKSARFGGVERARVSSQCWKRATRHLAHETAPALFGGIRTKFVGPLIEDAAKNAGLSDVKAAAAAKLVCAVLGADTKAGEVKTLIFISKDTAGNVVKALAADKAFSDELAADIVADDAKKSEKALKDANKKFKSVLKGLGENTRDAADIALFGRMVADDASQSVEGAAMFSHALSTHAVRNDFDFFSAVDDAKKDDADDAGAGHIGTTEFNSACYYRYIGVNLDLLDQSRLFDLTQKRAVLENFIKAVVMANPVARRNAMFGYTLPAYVLGVRRSGQPLSLANAFEKAVMAKCGEGLVGPSITALEAEWESLKALFALATSQETVLAKDRGNLADLVNAMLEGI